MIDEKEPMSPEDLTLNFKVLEHRVSELEGLVRAQSKMIARLNNRTTCIRMIGDSK